ncbi:MAG: Ig-like domain-containing protein [Lachnospiraceae bacterium]|nr:Ig-like domain-containing protein [Lachnospiraceae bacterium]
MKRTGTLLRFGIAVILTGALAASLIPVSAYEVRGAEHAETDIVEAEAESDSFAGSYDIQNDRSVPESEMVSYGSDGCRHEHVIYLSKRTVRHFNPDQVRAYTALCDEAAAVAEMDGSKDAVISVDSLGNIRLSFFVRNIAACTGDHFDTDVPPEVLSEEEVYDLFEEAVLPEHDDEEDADLTEDPEEPAYEDAEYDRPPLPEPEPAEDSEPEEYEYEPSEYVTGYVTEEAPAEYNDGFALYDDFTGFTPENIVLGNRLEEPIGEVIGDSIIDLDSLFGESELDYFRNRLGTDGKSVYDVAKKAMVNNNKTGFAFKNRKEFDNGVAQTISTVLSALELTYPSSFGWTSKGTDGGWSASLTYDYSSGLFTNTVTVAKSEYHSAGLDVSVGRKVDRLVENAYAYADDKYPGNPTYGIVKYFDDWICANSVYNYNGTSLSTSMRNSEEYYYCHRVYGVLLEGYGVCESYALAMTYLLDAAGIRNMYITGNGNGEGHAWNYVKMPDGRYYLIDSTWNDVGSRSSQNYFLIPDDSEHDPDGMEYSNALPLQFPSTATSRYRQAAEKFSIEGGDLVLEQGDERQLSVTDYYRDYNVKWTSSAPSVVSVDDSGMVKALKPGDAVIEASIGTNTSDSVKVTVYGIGSMEFAENSSNRLSRNVELSAGETLSFPIEVSLGGMTAEEAVESGRFDAPSVTVSNAKLAEATADLTENRIMLNVRPLGTGSVKCTVTFAGRSAILSLKVKMGLNPDWFIVQSPDTVSYTGKAYKPKVVLTEDAPSKVGYSVKYYNNVNAGTATVSITGKGDYSGTVEKQIEITPVEFDRNTQFASVKASYVYNGKAITPTTTVKHNNKKLKAGVDYMIRINGSDTMPRDAGTYTVSVIGKGNYSGSLSETIQFTITGAPISKAKASCTSRIRYVSGGVSLPDVTVRIGTSVLPQSDYDVTYLDASGKVIPEGFKLGRGKYRAVVTGKGSNLISSGRVTETVAKFTVY